MHVILFLVVVQLLFQLQWIIYEVSNSDSVVFWFRLFLVPAVAATTQVQTTEMFALILKQQKNRENILN